MRNPLRSEEAAFRFLWFVIGYFGLIAIGSIIDKWLGLAVFIAETLAIAAWAWLTRAGRKAG